MKEYIIFTVNNLLYECTIIYLLYKNRGNALLVYNIIIQKMQMPTIFLSSPQSMNGYRTFPNYL